MSRPAVSVVLPFHGSAAEAEQATDALLGLALHHGDELLLVDNTSEGVVQARQGVRVVHAPREPSSYYARNEGAAAARNDWLLFIDADCRPRADLADAYFAAGEPAAEVGALVGEVVGTPGQPDLVARYARSRGHLGQRVHVEHPFRPWGVTANLLVRRAAWEDVGGFHEGVRSGGDTEFSWRLQDAGWRLEYHPEAIVEHDHRTSVRSLARQAARYAAGRRWVMSRYPGALPRPTMVGELLRSAAGVVVWAVRGQRERSIFKALDAVYVVSRYGAFTLSNTPPGRPDAIPPASVAVVAGRYPDRDRPEAVAVVREHAGAVVDAAARPVRVDRGAAREQPIVYAEDDGIARLGRGLLWLARRPGVLRSTVAALGVAGAAGIGARARRLQRAGVREIVAATAEDRPAADAIRAALRLRGAPARTIV